MSKVAITGNASGTGTFTLAAPNSNSDRTLTLPDVTGTIVTTGSSPSFPTTIGVGGATPSTSGAGITFPATQSASSNANTLDDYEEGTWTPAISGITFTTNDFNNYTKIGNVVIATTQLAISTGTVPDVFTVTGLPFTSSSNSRVPVTLCVRDESSGYAQVSGPTGFMFSSTTELVGDLHGFVTGSDDRINISCVYFV
jgi:hypothetical protein